MAENSNHDIRETKNRDLQIPGVDGPGFLFNSPQYGLEGADRTFVNDGSEGNEEEQKEVEPAPIEYARLNHLARDHLVEKYFGIEVPLVDPNVNFRDDSHLPQFNLGDGLKVEERMSLSKEAASLIASIAQEETADSIDHLITPLIQPEKGINTMKLELPLLRTDNKSDCKNFGRRGHLDMKLKDIMLPLEVVDNEKGNGISLPDGLWDLGPQLLENVKTDKIIASKESVFYLQDALIVTWTREDSDALWDREMGYQKNTALEPVTPPLTPLQTRYVPYEPSPTDSTFHVPIWSNPASPTKKQLGKIEERLLEHDLPTPLRDNLPNNKFEVNFLMDTSVEHAIDLENTCNPMAFLDDAGLTFPEDSQERKCENLKIEETLTPEGPPISLPKTVRFSAVIEEMTLDTSQTYLNSPACENQLFDKVFGAAAETLNQKLEQEKLTEADATARVEVPVMDFSKADPPWKNFEGQSDPKKLLQIQLKFIKELVKSPIPSWPAPRKGNFKLRWVPWNKNQDKVMLNEEIELKEAVLENFLHVSSRQDIIDSCSLVWKNPGLMILRENDEDDDNEIEPGRFNHDLPSDLTSLIKKRTAELKRQVALDSETRNPKRVATDNGAKEAGEPLRAESANKGRRLSAASNKIPTNNATKMDLDVDEDSFGMLLGGTFSAANSLDNFLEIQGTKKAKLAESSYFGSKVTKSMPPQEQEKPQPPSINPPRKAPSPLPAPSIPSATKATTIIISSNLLKQRSLVKRLTQHMPTLQLIERDFSAHNTSLWVAGSVTRSPIISPLAAEADIIISPSTGVCITTLQKIKQRLLPGQKGKTAIREQVEKVSLRYDKLIVFVGENGQDESTSGLKESDSLALCEFIGFTLGLGTEIIVQFIAGGEETLSKWMASTITQNQLSRHFELLTDETLWELFLRRAGMNAFSAQAIISELKTQDGSATSSPTIVQARSGSANSGSGSRLGLAGFVSMDRTHRGIRFGPLCGKAVMERFSAVIDGSWEG